MAVTANQLLQGQNMGGLIGLPVLAARRLYQATIVFINRTSGAGEGYATDLDNAGANTFGGIAREETNNTAGASGDLDVEVYTEGDVVLTGAGLAQSDVGEKAYATDNYTVTPTAAGAVEIGRFVEFISATRMRVKIDVQQAN